MTDTPTAQRRITIRLTEHEHAEIVAKAGTRPLATFVREQVLKEITGRRRPPTPAPIKDQAALAHVLALLGTSPLVGSFRQAASDLQSGNSAEADALHNVLHSAAADLADIKTLLMRSLGVAER